MTAARKPIDGRYTRPIAALLWLAFSALLPSADAAGVYMWVDAKGITHYDDKSIYSSRVTQVELDRRVVAAKPFSVPPAGFAERVRQLCKINRERLGNYRQARELYGQDPAGNVYRMSPTQIGITIAETELDDAQLCAPGAADRLYAQRIAALTQPNANPAASIRQ